MKIWQKNTHFSNPFLNVPLQKKNRYPGSISNNLTHVLRLLISKRGHTPLLLPKSKRPPRTDNLDVVEAFATVTTTTPTILLVGPEAATTVHSKYIHTYSASHGDVKKALAC